MRSAFSLLLVVIIIGAAGLAMSLSILNLGVGESGLVQMRRGQSVAKWWAESCLANALIRLKEETDYQGETLSSNQQSCIINVSQSGEPWSRATVSVVAKLNDFQQSLSATVIRVDENWRLSVWREN